MRRCRLCPERASPHMPCPRESKGPQLRTPGLPSPQGSTDRLRRLSCYEVLSSDVQVTKITIAILDRLERRTRKRRLLLDVVLDESRSMCGGKHRLPVDHPAPDLR